jgi:hypothetical protein
MISYRTNILAAWLVLHLLAHCINNPIPFLWFSQYSNVTHLSPISVPKSVDYLTGRGPTGDYTIGAPLPVIISEVISRSHNSDPEYCLLSEERNPVRKNNKFLYCMFGAPWSTRGPRAAGSAGTYQRHWSESLPQSSHFSCKSIVLI